MRVVNGLGRYLIRATINDDLLHVLYQRRCQRLIMSEMLSRSARKRPRDDYEDFPRKRGRYSDPGPMAREPESTEQKLESLISRLGEKSHKSLESNLDVLSNLLINEMASMTDHILTTITKCVVDMKEKAFIYSTLLGLLNAKKFEVGEQALELVVAELRSALTLSQYDKARHLVVFLADLVNCKVVNVNSIVSLFDTLVTVTFEPDIPQIRSDAYIHMVLSALPIVGAELEERKRQELERLLVTIDNYMSKRSTPFLPMFQVWGEGQPHPQEDGLRLLWTQVKALREEDWKTAILLKLYTAFQSEMGGAYLHPLPSLPVPPHSPDSVYPLPSAVFRLFSSTDMRCSSPDTTLPSPTSADRFLAEEAVTAILASHQGSRKECASALVGFSETCQERLGVCGDYVIVEVLFGHMLRLPRPPQVLIYYSSVLIEMCKNNPAVYPQLLSQTTELLFSRLDNMNTIAIDRFAAWFSHHLSNFKYQWDWSKWNHVIEDGPTDNPSVKFVSEVFAKCIRLACYDIFVEMVPPEMTSLLPPEPAPLFKYRQDDDSAEGEVAVHLLEAIKNKESIDDLRAVLESLTEVGKDHQSVAQTRMAVLMQCVLKVGSKTITHCFLALVKFRPLMIELADEDDCKLTCLTTLAEFYTKNTQLHGLVIDKLLRMSVVDAGSVVSWLCSATPLFTRGFPWEVLTSTLHKTKTSLANTKRELADTRDKLRKVSALDEVALGGDERTDLEAKVEELEETKDERERTLRQLFLSLFERLASSLGGQGHSDLWTQCTLDHCRHLLVQNHATLSRMAALLEDTVFTVDVDPQLLEVFQQFQALL
ncbi:nuclear cap-binding protein subunit 1-like isoform X2 [Halichondria panicea]|uniref:nuclear cap-binding protein subunit 1-like isoform X2 n=1 Tax=Halichondria panicea TaxID=6063 RepID=UPI00312B664D